MLLSSVFQVDMFSYGMVLYELLSGLRPCMGQHQLQIAKKLSKGLRPALGSPEEVQFHCLQALMQECWDTKPEKVHTHLTSMKMHSLFFYIVHFNGHTIIGGCCSLELNHVWWCSCSMDRRAMHEQCRGYGLDSQGMHEVRTFIFWMHWLKASAKCKKYINVMKNGCQCEHPIILS